MSALHASHWAPHLSPYVGAGWEPYVGANLTVQQYLDLEKLHVEAAEKAELESRWLDAVKEWNEAASMLANAASQSGPVDKEIYYQRFKEYKRRADAAQAEADKQASRGALAASVWSGLKIAVTLAAGSALGLYLLERPLFNSLVKAPARRLYHRVIP